LDRVAEITRLLESHGACDRSRFDALVPLVYDELRRLARSHLRRFPSGRTLSTTDLVHETYLKLTHKADLSLHDRGHLMALTACAMRQVLVSRARARLRAKRGAGERPVALDEARVGRPSDAEGLLDLDRALTRLRARGGCLASVFECRYFGGLSEAETAEALGLSLRTVQRAWMRARAWLRLSLAGTGESRSNV
jgi:RNA polymerase sigma-70 factor, ECF subfamily